MQSTAIYFLLDQTTAARQKAALRRVHNALDRLERTLQRLTVQTTDRGHWIDDVMRLRMQIILTQRDEEGVTDPIGDRAAADLPTNEFPHDRTKARPHDRH